MATSKAPTRSEFLRDLFHRDPEVNLKEARDAWREAGHEGDISSSTFFNAKTAFNKDSTGESGSVGETAEVSRPQVSSQGRKSKRTSPSKSNGRGATPELKVRSGPARTADPGRVLDEVEDGIDELIFKVRMIGGKPEILEALRTARRLLYHGRTQ